MRVYDSDSAYLFEPVSNTNLFFWKSRTFSNVVDIIYISSWLRQGKIRVPRPPRNTHSDGSVGEQLDEWHLSPLKASSFFDNFCQKPVTSLHFLIVHSSYLYT